MKSTISTTLLFSLTLLVAQPVLAHHPLGGLPMETFADGVLSGIGHPLLGIDHLFFVIVAGILALYSGSALTAPLVLIGGVLAGVLINVAGVHLPATELLIALSLIILGGIGLYGRALSILPLVVLFGGLGLIHGWAFGQSIVQQEAVSQSVLAGYLIGLAAVQWLLATGAGMAVYRLLGALQASDTRARLTCAVITGVGVTFMLEHIEAVVLAV